MKIHLFKKYIEKFNSENISFLLSYCLIIILVISFFSVGMEVDYWTFLNSDTLYMPTVYKDLFEDGNGLKGWNFNAAPNFFPEMFLYLIIRFFTTDFLLANLLYGIVQVFIIVRLVNLIFKLLSPINHLKISTVANFIFSICFFIVHYAKVLDVPFYLTTTAFHTGAFVMQLFSVYLLLGIVEKNKTSNCLLLALVGFLTVLSDNLFIIYFSVPLLILSVYSFISGRRSFAIRSAVLSIVPAALGIIAFNLLKTSNYIHFTEIRSDYTIEKAIQSSIVMKQQFVAYVAAFNLRSLFMIIAGVAFLMLTLLVVKELKKKFLSATLSIYLAFLFISFFVIMFTPIAAGNYSNYDTLRYVIPVLYLLILSLPLLITTLFTIRKVNAKKIILFFGVLLNVVALQKIDAKGLIAFLNYYPENAQHVDGLARKYGFQKGVGHYWNSHYITMFSRENVKIYPVFPELTPYFHSVNTSLYFNEDAEFDFILPDGLGSCEKYNTRFKNKGEFLVSGVDTILMLPKFRYDSLSNKPYLVMP